VKIKFREAFSDIFYYQKLLLTLFFIKAQRCSERMNN